MPTIGDKRCVILSAAKYPTDDRGFYVILSASEISHDQSDKVYARQFFGGILHYYYAAHNADAF